MTSFLLTKTEIPPQDTRHMRRPRLLQKAADYPARLLLVSAPAGFGKSSFLVEWANAVSENDVRVAWYSLDEQDNDPARFAAYLSRAFVQAISNSDLYNKELPHDLQETATRLLNCAAAEPAGILLVLDDYHLIHNPDIHTVLNIMCEHMPAGMQIAIGSRADPPLQLARMRARRQIQEIRALDLRFSQNEINELMETLSGRPLAADAVETLEQTTEGWAAALALLSMSVASHEQRLNINELEQQLAAFSPTRQYIYDYLAAEVFSAQPENVRRFLLDTSVLNYMTPAICEFLSDDQLEEVAGRNLFIVSLSDDEPVYRYHHLFSDFLRRTLNKTNPAYYLQQHLQAAKWHAENGDIVAAVNHSLDANDHFYAAKLIENSAWEVLTSQGEIMTLMNWLSLISPTVLKQHPRLCLYFSRAFYLTGDIMQSEKYLKMATEHLEKTHEESNELKALLSISYNYRATLAGYRGEITQGLEWIKQAEAGAHLVNTLDRVRISNTRAHLLFLQGNISHSRQAYEQSLSEATSLKHLYLMLDAQFYLAQLEITAGNLQLARERCETILADNTIRISPLSAIMLPLAFVYYAQNNLNDSQSLLNEAIHLAKSGHIPDVLWTAFTLLAQVHQSRGAHESALDCLRQAQEVSQSFHSPAMQVTIEVTKAHIFLLQGILDKALSWANDQPVPPISSTPDSAVLCLARILIACGRPLETVDMMENLIEQALPAGRIYTVMEARLLQAIACHALQRPKKALDSLQPVLEYAAQERIIRLFLDTGTSVIPLLELAARENITPQNTTKLLHIAGQTSPASPEESLTEREIEILQLIADGASNQLICEKLVISLGTVKSHIHHIMNKLGVQNRTQAVAMARSLNILTD